MDLQLFWLVNFGPHPYLVFLFEKPSFLLCFACVSVVCVCGLLRVPFSGAM